MDWEEIYARLVCDDEDATAHAALERRVRGWARRALRRRGWHAVEDAVADTCSSVAVSLRAARGAETFVGFVYGHFLNVRHRVARQYPPAETLDGVDVPAPPVSGDRSPSERHLVALRCALEELPERERRAVALRYLEELSAAEIARTLGVSEGNARRIVFNGLARLRRRLRSPGGVRGEMVEVA
jgi:RNA polymerase sigma factor (sigma-70 family)